MQDQMMIEAIGRQVADMMKIAERAIEVELMERVLRQEEADLSAAYRGFKDRLGVKDRIEPETEGFRRMQAATKGEYAAVQEAKRKLRNAKSRLKTAIRSFGQSR